MTNPPVLPIPSLEMRKLVGPTDVRAFDNPSGRPIYSEAGLKIEEKYFESVFDFGCGCGRLARQLIQQKPVPKNYQGIDLHLGMIKWCQDNLTPFAPQFQFEHHDVFNAAFNPGNKPPWLPYPFPDKSFTLVIAHSVFTHLVQENAVFYLNEIRRVLKDDGLLVASWFLFDKRYFPMMQDFQNALYINISDPTNAVIFSRDWIAQQTHDNRLKIIQTVPPAIRGFHWLTVMSSRADAKEVELGEDLAPFGAMPPPTLTSEHPSQIGLK